MANKVNKVIDRNGSVLIDLTNDTVSPGKVLAGTKFHGPDGKEYFGGVQQNELDMLKYNFIDYDGTLLYSFTDDEIDAMEELPAGPDHTEDNLTFQEWNWDLEDLKNWDRTRPDRPIVGANLITTDGKTYIYLDIPNSSFKFAIYRTSATESISIDWGDGTVVENYTGNSYQTHTYETPGKYTIIVETSEPISNTIDTFGMSSDSSYVASKYIEKINFGNIKCINGSLQQTGVKIISIPANVVINGSNVLWNCYGVQSLIIPKGNTNISLGTYLYSLKYISIPNGVTSVYITDCSIKNITLPDTLTSYPSFDNWALLRSVYLPKIEGAKSYPQYMFRYCMSLETTPIIHDTITSIGSNFMYMSNSFTQGTAGKTYKIPDSVTTIGNSFIYDNHRVTIDLSEQTKVISISSTVFGSYTKNRGFKILVPQALLSQYKSASYWSSYAECMVGV